MAHVSCEELWGNLDEDEAKLLRALSTVARAYDEAGESGASAKAYQMICALKLSLDA